MAYKGRRLGKTENLFKKGVEITRQFTKPNVNPLDDIKYKKASSVITNPDGSVVFSMDNVEVPESWSQLAVDILVSKYFRKRGVPDVETGMETSIRQVVSRIVGAIKFAGEDMEYFSTSEEANVFADELAYLLVNQIGAFNSPVWFNCGLWHSYGIEGTSGNYAWDEDVNDAVLTRNSYERPQCSACFIQSVNDDLMSIFELAKNEARLFKFGSGTGTNFSLLRSKYEKLSGGGTSSGLMSFLEVLDRGAGATKSGGTTRRAAKMVTLDIDHPEIIDFIEWKVKEEKKVSALISAGYSSDFNGEAYKTVSGQNSNNSIRVPDDFMQAYLDDGTWNTTFRTTGEVHKTYKAKEIFRKISDAAWGCADPGLQFDSIINKWHTCKNSGRINASNPCSEFMFIDDSACNLASINLTKFFNPETGVFDVDGFKHACKIFTIAQDILVDFSSYPTARIAKNSHLFRPLGLGYANLGTLLMLNGLAYDSDEGRSLASAVTAIMTATAYSVSAEIAGVKGAFTEFDKNREPMIEVIQLHRDASYEISEFKACSNLLEEAHKAWDRALADGARHGFRNAQVTVLAPTGTIGLLMDCDTTGIEPDYSLVKFKKLAGGGYFKIVNQSVPFALKKLGYNDSQIQDIIKYAQGASSMENSPHINENSLRDKGFTEEDLARVKKMLPQVMDLKYAFSPFVLGKDTMSRLGFDEEKCKKSDFDVLKESGFTDEQISEATDFVCGRMTLEGAPHLKEEHLKVFDCANRCGKYGKRFIEPMGHVKMMAAAQAFISGAISKTVNLPNETTVEQIEKIYFESWKQGLKAVALYRDGSKQAQPLASKGEESKEKSETTSNKIGIAATPVGLAASGSDDTFSPPKRRRLPKKRNGQTFEARVGGQKVYLRTGEYSDGDLGEMFVDMHKEGAAFRSMMNCFAIAVSLGLQYGVPLEEYVDCFTFTRFEPQGVVDHPNIKMATSVIDFIFRLLGMEYLGRTDFVQVKPTQDEDVKMQLMSTTAQELMEEKRKGDALNVSANPVSPLISKQTLSGAVVTSYSQSADKKNAQKTENKQQVNVIVKKQSASANTYSSSGLSAVANAQTAHLTSMMGDAPFCDQCGHVTIRNGACYKCLNCGNSMGCS